MNTSLLNETAYRVAKSSPQQYNYEIEKDTIARLEKIGHDRKKIEERLKELDSEWDVERAIEANASTLLLTTLALATFSNRKWLLLSGTIAGFLFQHAIQGWCPPVPVLRKLGFRSQREIDNERTVLLGRIGFLPDAMADSKAAIQLLKR